MSTFNGIVEEFPDIRIDYFRHIAGVAPPLACFLSHVHSDHLLGLDSLRSPFVWCSSGTKELLLRLEKYPHRLNFAKGILESRKIHYRHLKRLLKALPLNTPTEIELVPGRTIRVTLLDANHCLGAVMFLIDNGEKAVLYTGDVRSEPWWVNALVRNPIVLPYTIGLRELDKIYLDTTFATKREPYRTFPTKAEGLQELLLNVTKYPKETVFYFDAWTFGYEEVYLALASVLRSQIHVDSYKLNLYKAVAKASEEGFYAQDGAALSGFKYGNVYQSGCLTTDISVRLHSCERGTNCEGLKSSSVVWITPIITRTARGVDVRELGAGGGGNDFEQVREIEVLETSIAFQLAKLCSRKIVDVEAREKALALISNSVTSGRQVLPLDGLWNADELEDMPLETFATLLGNHMEECTTPETVDKVKDAQSGMGLAGGLPTKINFPYSRHASYEELRHLVGVFKPKDLYPCTVDKESWTSEVSMRSLFGDLCSRQLFKHDNEMEACLAAQGVDFGKKRSLNDTQHNSQETENSTEEFATAHGCTEGISNRHHQRFSRSELESRHSRKKARRFHQPQAALASDASETVLRTRDASTDTSMDQRVYAIKVPFEASIGQRVGFSSSQIQEVVDNPRHVERSRQSPKLRESRDAATDYALQDMLPRFSMPTISHTRPKDIKVAEPLNVKQQPGYTSERPMELSGKFSTSLSDDEGVLDILPETIYDKEFRRQVEVLSDDLRCSLIMARTIINAKGFQPSRRFLAWGAENADRRTKHDPVIDVTVEWGSTMARNIQALRDLLPTAWEESCHEVLLESKGNFRKARDRLALSEEARLANDRDCLSEAEAIANVAEKKDSQISLSDSAFASQHSQGSEDDEASRANIRNRKEAYKAARHKDGWEWHSYSSIPSSSVKVEEDKEL